MYVERRFEQEPNTKDVFTDQEHLASGNNLWLMNGHGISEVLIMLSLWLRRMVAHV